MGYLCICGLVFKQCSEYGTTVSDIQIIMFLNTIPIPITQAFRWHSKLNHSTDCFLPFDYWTSLVFRLPLIIFYHHQFVPLSIFACIISLCAFIQVKYAAKLLYVFFEEIKVCMHMHNCAYSLVCISMQAVYLCKNMCMLAFNLIMGL